MKKVQVEKINPLGKILGKNVKKFSYKDLKQFKTLKRQQINSLPDKQKIILPGVKKTIYTVMGIAHYQHSEIDDEYGNWNDNWRINDGYWVTHESNKHHIYKIIEDE